MDFDNIYFDNTEEEDEELTQQGGTFTGVCLALFSVPYSAFVADVPKTEAGISPVTGLVRGGARRGPDIDWREIARFFLHLQDYFSSG